MTPVNPLIHLPDGETMLLYQIFDPISLSLSPSHKKRPTNKGIVRLHLFEPEQVAILWICSIGRKTEGNRYSMSIQMQLTLQG